MQIKIDKFDHLGNGIGKNNNKIVFVKKALINEMVDVKIASEKKNYQNAIIDKIINASPLRINPICPYYSKCGGCDFLHCKNNCEIDFKKGKARELIGNSFNFHDTKEFHYRNKVTLHVKDNKVGFYEEKTNNIIEIDYCYLLDDRINEILKKISYYLKNNKSNISEIIIRANKETMLFVNSYVDNDFVKYFNFVDTIIANNKVIKGKGYIYEEIGEYQFRISPKSFFQVNTIGLEKIYSILNENLTKKYNNVLDLYSGTSVMGILMSKYALKVTSIEYNESATNDAFYNIQHNQINNLKIINDRVENCIDKLSDIDLIIIDPPRSGLSEKTINYINKLNPETVIYISCNMITLKRDLDILYENYYLKTLSLVNMFPKTYHVECIVMLELK